MAALSRTTVRIVGGPGPGGRIPPPGAIGSPRSVLETYRKRFPQKSPPRKRPPFEVAFICGASR